MRALTARLRRLEQARHAADHARPTAEELRHFALTGEGRDCLANWQETLVRYRGRLDRLVRALEER